MVSKRTAIPEKVKIAVLTESGYMGAVPTCRCLLIELHHIVPVKSDGKNEASNLLPLCPNHHTLFEIGKIKQESIEVWKTMLVVSGELYFGLPPLYKVSLTDKGNRIIEAWFSGSRDQVRQAPNDITLYNSE